MFTTPGWPSKCRGTIRLLKVFSTAIQYGSSDFIVILFKFVMIHIYIFNTTGGDVALSDYLLLLCWKTFLKHRYFLLGSWAYKIIYCLWVCEHCVMSIIP